MAIKNIYFTTGRILNGGQGMTTLLRWVLAENPAGTFEERLGRQPVYEKTVTIGDMPLAEVAYGWRDVHTIHESQEPQQCL